MFPAISIRQALTAERAALEALQTRASLANPGDRDAIITNPDAITIPIHQFEDGCVFVAELNNELVGFAAIQTRDDRDIDLDGLFVEPRAWRQGIGQRLVEHCEDVARRVGARALHVIGNPHARGFYSATGFVSIGVVRTRFGDAVQYYKILV
jgi:GNAT superfamily N-acetyltransferase